MNEGDRRSAPDAPDEDLPVAYRSGDWNHLTAESPGLVWVIDDLADLAELRASRE